MAWKTTDFLLIKHKFYSDLFQAEVETLRRRRRGSIKMSLPKARNMRNHSKLKDGEADAAIEKVISYIGFENNSKVSLRIKVI